MILDARIANRLRDRRVIDFAVAVTAVSDKINNDIAVEGVAIFGCESRDAQDCIRIFRIYVEDWNRQTLRQVGCVT